MTAGEQNIQSFRLSDLCARISGQHLPNIVFYVRLLMWLGPIIVIKKKKVLIWKVQKLNTVHKYDIKVEEHKRHGRGVFILH